MSIDISGLAEDILRKVMKFADDGAVMIEKNVSHQVRFSHSKIDIVKTWYETSVAIMMDKDKKVNVLELTLPAIKNIDQVLEAAKTVLEKSRPRPIYAQLPEPSKEYQIIGNKVDRDVRDRPEKMADIAKNSIDVALKEGAKRVAGSIRGNYTELALCTSKINKVLEDSFTNAYIDVRAFLDSEESGHASQLARGFGGLNSEKLGVDASKIAKLNRNSISIDQGRYDTVITPNAVAAIMNLVAGATSAFSVLMGMSFFSQKMGKKVANEGLTIFDNPHNSSCRLPRSFDDEGIATRKNVLIEDGVLKTYLHNRFTALAFNSDFTGNAGWIMPNAWHLEVVSGDHGREELIKSLDKGLILNNVTYIRFQNYLQGDFSGIIRDGLFYVEGGEIKGAVKGLRFSDNAIRLLHNISAKGNDVENIFHWWLEYRVSVTTPSILVNDCGYTRAFGL